MKKPSKKELMKKELDLSIIRLNNKLKHFKPREKESEEVSALHNRLIVEKAVLKKELENLKAFKSIEVIKKTVRKIRGKKLICDYFK